VSLVFADGRELANDQTFECEVAVVGSGPGGAVTARALAEAGLDVMVIEEGPYVAPDEYPEDAARALAALYRDMGFALTRGRSRFPLLQGRVLGGSSAVNSAICWRLPRDVHDQWVADDPALGEALPWDALEAAAAEIEGQLAVAPTDPAVAGPNNLLMARGADRLGLEHRPIHRNVAGCQGLGRCNRGCPIGAKLSMERSFLPDAVVFGARLCTSVTVEEIMRGDAVYGVAGRAAAGGRVRVLASRAVVLAASAIGTPALLIANGIRHGPVGRRFQCHPGVVVAGRFPEPVRAWTGATQGHEVLGLRAEGIKIESVAFDLPLLALRQDGIGVDLANGIVELDHWATWAAAIRSEGMGSVRGRRHGRRGATVRFDLTRNDVERVRRAVAALSELLFAAGATEVVPGVAGWDRRISDPKDVARLEREGPVDARAYSLASSHMFGTCRMGSDPRTSVVGPDFRHHAVDRLYIADSSVFPTNTGVNPQLSIMAMATLCAASILRQS
jgi:choline dehydrogenase-like flavoprotein